MSKFDETNSLFDNNNQEIDDEEDDEEDEDYNPANDKQHLSGASDDDEDGLVNSDDESHSKKRSSNQFIKNDNDKNNSIQEDNLEKIDESKIESLWKDFCSDIKSDSSKNSSQSVEKNIVKKQYDFAGETVVIEEEEVNINKSIENKNKLTKDTETKNELSKTVSLPNTSNRQPIKRTGGLSSLLGQLKKPKMSTLTKSLHDWKDFKKSQNIEEELEQHKRSKNSFLERQAFLTRTDFREFEREKSIRDHDRKIRDTKQN